MFYPKKSLGQNFLIDKNIANKIIKLINNYDKKNIIEIGPGKGALTEIIYNKKPKNLHIIEKDKFLYNQLISKYIRKKSIIIYNDDALKFNFNQIPKPKSIIANLPYNISIKLICMWLNNISDYSEIVVMIQKDVAKKMEYKNTNKMNRLNFLISTMCNYKIEFDVSKNVFFPKPKVLSSVIKIIPKSNNIHYNIIHLENFSKMLFRFKRKKLINVLNKEIKNFMENNQDLNNVKKILNSRAEDLKIEQIHLLFKAFLQT